MAEDDKKVNGEDTPQTPGGFVMPELKKVESANARPAAAASAPAEEIEDDTRTRRTVKLGSLRPTRPAEDFPQLNPVPPVPTVSTDSGVIADPLSSRADAPSEVMDDTRTRKTLLVKPLTPKDVKPLPPEALRPAGEVPNVLDDTRTRKTLKLSAMSAGTPKMSVPPGMEVPTRSAEVDDTIKLQRPTPKMMPGGLGAPVTPGVGVALPKSAPAQPVDPSRQTVKLEQMAEVETQEQAGAMADDDTHTRPVAPLNVSKQTIRLKPSDLPASGPQPLQQEAAPAAPSTEAQRAASAPTVSMVRPEIKKPAAAPAPAPAAAPAPAEEAVPEAPAPQGAAAKRGKKRTLKLDKEAGPTPEAQAEAQAQAAEFAKLALGKDANEVSKFYTAVAVAVVLLTLFSTTLTVIQYINFWEPSWVNNQPIEIPVVSGWVNK